MKNWMRYLLTTVLLAALLSCTAAAKNAGEAYLKVQDSNVAVYLNLPEGQNMQLTSIHFGISVDVEAGELTQKPVFTFADGLTSEIKDSRVTQIGHEYYVDVVVSGTSRILDQVVNDAAGVPLGTPIGTLVLAPLEPDTFCAEVSLISEAEDSAGETAGTPVVRYAGRNSAQANKALVTTAETIHVGKIRSIVRDCNIALAQTSYVYDGTAKTPAVTVADGERKLEEGKHYTVEYLENVNAGLGVARIKAVEGSGYEGERTRNFEIAKAEHPANMPENTILAPGSARTLADVSLPEGWFWENGDALLVPGGTVEGKAVYQDSINYEVYSLQIAVSQDADAPSVIPENPENPDVPGASDTPQTPQTPGASETPGTAKPGKQEKLNVPSPKAVDTFGTGTVKLSWKKVSGVSGYQVFQKDKKTGKYKLVKTINGAKNTSYSGNYAGGRTYTFKVRCFMEHEGSGKVYSAYSKAVKVTVSKFNKSTRPTASGTLKPKKQKIKFKWSKVAGADGYQIYWYNPAKEKYVLKHTVKGANKTSFAGKISKYHKSYTFKIRAYTVKPNKKTKVYSKFSTVFTVDVP